MLLRDSAAKTVENLVEFYALDPKIQSLSDNLCSLAVGLRLLKTVKIDRKRLVQRCGVIPCLVEMH